MTRLFLDGVRQKPWLLGLSAVLFVQQFDPVVTFDFIPRREPDGGVFFSVLMWFLGFQSWSRHIARHVAGGRRAIRVLPVGVRDAARGYWLAAVVPPAIVCGVTIVAGLVLLDDLDPLEGSGGRGFDPLSLFLLWGVACAATIACVGLAGQTGSTVTRELGYTMLGLLFLAWAYVRTEPPPLGTVVANAELLVATLLVATTTLTYILAPQLFEHGSDHRRRVTPTGGPPQAADHVASGVTGPIEPCARTFGWSLGLGLLISVAALTIPRAFAINRAIGIAVLASLVVYMGGVTVFAQWTPALRVLRVLPISTNRLPLLLFGQPACVYAGAIAGAAAVWLVWPDLLAWLGLLAMVLLVVFGLMVSGLSVLWGIGVVRKEAQLRAIMGFTAFAIGLTVSRFLSGSDAAVLDSVGGVPILDWVGGAAGVGVALAAVGCLVLRAALSRRGSLYRS